MMTSDEAIDGLKKIRDGDSTMPETEWIAYCNLGIEALKLLNDHRAGKFRYFDDLLPGETMKHKKRKE